MALPLFPFISVEQAKQAAFDLRAATEVIEELGWIQLDVQNDDGVCAIGALNYHCEGDARLIPSFNSPALLAACCFRRVIGIELARYNDEPGRTKAEVQAKMHHAADLINMEVGKWKSSSTS